MYKNIRGADLKGLIGRINIIDTLNFEEELIKAKEQLYNRKI